MWGCSYCTLENEPSCHCLMMNDFETGKYWYLFSPRLSFIAPWVKHHPPYFFKENCYAPLKSIFKVLLFLIYSLYIPNVAPSLISSQAQPPSLSLLFLSPSPQYFFKFSCIGVCPSVCAMWRQTRTLDALELELYMVESHCVGAVLGTKSRSSARVTSALSCWAIFLVPLTSYNCSMLLG